MDHKEFPKQHNPNFEKMKIHVGGNEGQTH